MLTFTLNNNPAQGIPPPKPGGFEIFIQGTNAQDTPVTEGEKISGTTIAVELVQPSTLPSRSDLYILHVVIPPGPKGLEENEVFLFKGPYTMSEFPGWHIVSITGKESKTAGIFIRKDADTSKAEENAKAAGYESVAHHWAAVHQA